MHKPTTIGMIRVLSTGIMAIAAYVSYGTQRGVLLGWDVDTQSAALIPITVDLLAIICNLAIHAHGVERAGRRVALGVLVAAGLVSMAANATAGATLGSRVAHVWCVAAYLLAEWVAAKVKAAKSPTASLAVTGTSPAVHPVAAIEHLAARGVPAPVSAPPATETRVGAFGLPMVKPVRRPIRDIRVLTPAA